MEPLAWDEFQRVEIRVGTFIDVEDFPEARKPSFKLRIDFGPDIGSRKSRAQISDCYSKESLLWKQVLAVVNFSPRQIGPIMSGCLIIGAPRHAKRCSCVAPPSIGPLYTSLT